MAKFVGVRQACRIRQQHGQQVDHWQPNLQHQLGVQLELQRCRRSQKQCDRQSKLCAQLGNDASFFSCPLSKPMYRNYLYALSVAVVAGVAAGYYYYTLPEPEE
tara:strand:- start:1808 stop:2119 length:312 start_codon:yes stop_codon:yes gene_type:complete